MSNGKIKIKHIRFEAAEALNDAEVASMTDSQYRAYWQLIFYLYCNYGKCSAEPEVLASICMHTPDVLYFQQKIWPKIGKKFRKKMNVVTHKRVTKELKRAKKLLQAKINAGIRSGQVRRAQLEQRSNTRPTNENENEIEGKPSNSKRSKVKPYSEDKETNRKTNTSDLQNLSVSDFASVRLRFVSTLENIITPAGKSDRIANINLVDWLIDGIIKQKFSEQIFNRVLDYAYEAQKKGNKPIALFFSTLRRELGYTKKV